MGGAPRNGALLDEWGCLKEQDHYMLDIFVNVVIVVCLIVCALIITDVDRWENGMAIGCMMILVFMASVALLGFLLG